LSDPKLLLFTTFGVFAGALLAVKSALNAALAPLNTNPLRPYRILSGGRLPERGAAFPQDKGWGGAPLRELGASQLETFRPASFMFIGHLINY